MGLITQALSIHEDDPAVAIRSRVNPYLDDIRIGGRDVLVATYEPAKNARTKGGLYLPDQSREEYRWQGVTGLILAIGPLAYNTEKSVDWFCDDDGNPKPPKIGDWVMFDIKDTHPFYLKDQPCRLVADQFIRGILARPDLVA